MNLVRTVFAFLFALSLSSCALLERAAAPLPGGIRVAVSASPEPVRNNQETTLAFIVTDADGAPLDLSGGGRLTGLAFKVVSQNANDIQELSHSATARAGEALVKVVFVFGGRYSLLADGFLDGKPVHSLLTLPVLGPEEGDSTN